MLTFTLAISCCHFMANQFALVHGPNIPGSDAIVLFTELALLLSTATSTPGYYFCFGSIPSFFLESFLPSSPSSSILGIYQPVEFIIHCPIFCLFIPFGVLSARIMKWFAVSFFSGPCFVRTLHHDRSILGGPTWHGSYFHTARQGCDPCDQFG